MVHLNLGQNGEKNGGWWNDDDQGCFEMLIRIITTSPNLERLNLRSSFFNSKQTTMFCKALVERGLKKLEKLQLAETMNFAEKKSSIDFVKFLEGADSLRLVDLQR